MSILHDNALPNDYPRLTAKILDKGRVDSAWGDISGDWLTWKDVLEYDIKRLQGDTHTQGLLKAIGHIDQKPNGSGQLEETTGEIGDRKEHGESKEHPWNDRDSDYMGASEAVQMAEKLNRRISLPTVSRLVRRPDCPIRFMRKSNSVRVHIADFKAHLETRPKIKPTGEDISDEALDEYMAHVEATKAAMRHRKGGTEPED